MNKIPTFVVVGNAGSGKSTLCNTLSSTQNFKESNSIYSETKETIGIQGSFNGQQTFVIDTPGLQDGSGLDTPHLVQMTQYIKSKEDTQAFIIVINFFHYRFDQSIIKLFQLVSNMYPQTKWYNNLAVVWSHYFTNLPENLKEKAPKKNEFKKWFKDNIANDISENEAKNIPQFFVDSYEARKENNESNTELSHLIAWISQLEPLLVKCGEIKTPDAQIKEKTEEKQTKTISETQKLNVKTTIVAEFKRYKCKPYIGDEFYTEWEEIEGTRKENKEVLPVEPVGPETKERKVSEIITPTIDKSYNYYTYKNTWLGKRHHVDQRRSYQIKKTIVEERTAQPMNDGTTKYGEWAQVKELCKEEIINVREYENRD